MVCRLHGLVIARDTALRGLGDLTAAHLPLLQSMEVGPAGAASWLCCAALLVNTLQLDTLRTAPAHLQTVMHPARGPGQPVHPLGTSSRGHTAFATCRAWAGSGSAAMA